MTSWRAVASKSSASRSSMTVECGATPASRGKPSQQRLAEGVDGLDVHAARAIQHPGEQLARARRMSPRRLPAESAASSASSARRRRWPSRPAGWRCGSPSPPPPPWCRSGRGCGRLGCPPASGAARGRSAPWSCRCRRRRRPRPRRSDRWRRAAARADHRGCRGRARPFIRLLLAGGPFLDAREVLVVAVARRRRCGRGRERLGRARESSKVRDQPPQSFRAACSARPSIALDVFAVLVDRRAAASSPAPTRRRHRNPRTRRPRRWPPPSGSCGAGRAALLSFGGSPVL